MYETFISARAGLKLFTPVHYVTLQKGTSCSKTRQKLPDFVCINKREITQHIHRFVPEYVKKVFFEDIIKL